MKLPNLIPSDLSRDSFATLGLKVCVVAAGFGAQVFAARLLGVDEYGVYATVLAWFGIVLLISKLGFDSGAVKYVAHYRSSGRFEELYGFVGFVDRAVVLSACILGLILAAGAWVLTGPGDAHLRRTFWVAAACLPIMARLAVSDGVVRGLGDVVRAFGLSQTLRSALFLSLMALAMLSRTWIDWSPEAVMALYGAAAIPGLAALEQSKDASLKQTKGLVVRADHLNEWMVTSFKLLLVEGFAIVLFRIDTAMVGSMVGSREAGIYSVASRVAAGLVLVLSVVNVVLGPRIAAAFASGDKQQMQELATFAARISGAAAVGAGIVLVFWGRDILEIFGKAFGAGYVILLILTVGQLGNAVVGNTGQFLNMTEHQGRSAAILAASAVANIVVNVVFIRWWGSIGAAVATASMNILTNGTLACVVWRQLDVVPLPYRFGAPSA